MQFFRPDYLLKQENICEQTRHFKVGKWSLKIEKPLVYFHSRPNTLCYYGHYDTIRWTHKTSST